MKKLFEIPTRKQLLTQANKLINRTEKKMNETNPPLPTIPGPVSKRKIFQMLAKY